MDAGHLIEDDQIEIDETSIQVSNRSMKSEFQNSIGNRSVAEAHPTAYSPGEMRCNTSTPLSLSLSLFIYLSIYLSIFDMNGDVPPGASTGQLEPVVRTVADFNTAEVHTREREREREREKRKKTKKKIPRTYVGDAITKDIVGGGRGHSATRSD